MPQRYRQSSQLQQVQSLNYMNAQSLDQFSPLNHQMANAAVQMDAYLQDEMLNS